MSKRGESVAAFKPIVTKIIQDIQERLIFVAQTFIHDRIANYEPNSNDLDFPNKLLKGNSKICQIFSSSKQRTEFK
jgi:hypothetical protein